MKVALEAGEVLEVAIIDGDRVVGNLSLQLKGIGGSRVGRPAGSSSAKAASSDEPAAGRRRKRKPMSAETKARMAAAQKARWEKKNGPSNTSDNNG